MGDRYTIESIYDWTQEESDKDSHMIFDNEAGGSTNLSGTTKAECEDWLQRYNSGDLSAVAEAMEHDGASRDAVDIFREDVYLEDE